MLLHFPLSREAIQTQLWCMLNIARAEKYTFRKLVVALNIGGHSIPLLNSVLYHWRFSNQFDIVSETPYRCDAVGRELKLCLLLIPEKARKVRVRKQRYVFILTDFKKRCFDVSFLTSICVNNSLETENALSK